MKYIELLILITAGAFAAELIRLLPPFAKAIRKHETINIPTYMLITLIIFAVLACIYAGLNFALSLSIILTGG